MAVHLKSWLQSGVAALQFLTRLPVPITVPFDARTLARSSVWYPVVGLVVGGLLSAFGAALGHVLPPLPAAVVVLGLWIALTGGLHLDGLMDTADGLLSHRSREQMLEIMKDSRVGAMGAIAGGLQLMLKASLLTVWTGAERWAPWLLLPAAAVLSRAFLVAAMAGWPYARAEGAGLGGLYRRIGKRHAWAAGGAAVLLALLLGVAAYGPARWQEAIIAAAVLAGIAGIAGFAMSSRISGKLGGLTGDTYGAQCELLETLLLLIMAAGIHVGWL